MVEQNIQIQLQIKLYRNAWQFKGRSWLKPSKEDKDKAYCSLCKSDFRINNSGLAQVKHHEGTEKHDRLFKDANANSSFVAKNGQLSLNLKQPAPKELTHQEKVTKAVIIHSLHTIDAKIPFASTDSDGERFRLVSWFPNSPWLQASSDESQVCPLIRNRSCYQE